ncbi:hypothetical protein [Chitinasiproducens palmae]|uniref:hypothetical protein n=1 Tax=Chitinasiproducens palmae TaxID=1770053 RepID=UPI00147D3244|nr:hypothetical protein [Chitinasiproducens palmae]
MFQTDAGRQLALQAGCPARRLRVPGKRLPAYQRTVRDPVRDPVSNPARNAVEDAN